MQSKIKYKVTILILCFNFTFAFELIEPLPMNVEYHKQKAVLGKKLFHDVALSKDNTISCASCHNIKKGGVDNKKYSLGVDSQEGIINTPTVLNTRYNIAQMWDGRAKNFKHQVMMPLQNPKEMNISIDEVLRKLKQMSSYKVQFQALYKDGLTQENFIDALAEFEKALVTPNSKFDRYLRGDTTALNKVELEGFELFKENGCISCHNGINIGGNLYQKVGILKKYVGDHNLTGRYNITKRKKDMYHFKVPTLRNIALTSPYLHDGSQKTLEDVVEFMMVYQVGIIADTQEIHKIVIFLKTLTGEIPKVMEEQ